MAISTASPTAGSTAPTPTSGGDDEADQEGLSLLTYNIRSIKDGWWRWRGRAAVDELARLAPDVIALQEASTWSFQAQVLAWLLRRKTGLPYRAWHARKAGWQGILEGCALVTTLDFRGRKRLPLPGDRVAQIAALAMESGRRFVIANAHFANGGGPAGELRLRQAQRLLEVMPRRAPAIVAGDLNAQPASRTVAAFAPRFRSAHLLAHDCEPQRTASLFAEAGHVLDYILVGESWQVVSCAVALAAADDRGRYLSDHFAVLARLKLAE